MLVVLVLICALVLGFYSYTWRYRSQQLRRNVIDAVSSLIAESHTLDGLTTAAVTLIQEIEVVARGYEMYVHLGCFKLDHKANGGLVVMFCHPSAVLRSRVQSVDA
jgi:Mysoin-binding motif of peroxisomes